MATKKLEKFEIGKCYKAQKFSGITYYLTPTDDGFGINIKESKFKKGESYIMVESHTFLEPKECIEITKEEFINAKKRLIKLIEEKSEKI